MKEYQLSSQSRRFIDDLRVYLFSSGKNNQEINEIVEELSDHLADAELNGKSIERVVGTSPKEYMESINKEMNIDYEGWTKYIFLFLIGSISFIVIGDVLEGTLSYSVLQIIATILISLLFLGGVFVTFRLISKNQWSRTKQVLILFIPIFISILMFSGLILLDPVYSTPIVELGVVGRLLTGGFALVCIILFSVWARTAILPIFLAALHIPPYVLSFSPFAVERQLIMGMIITYVVIGVYLLYVFKKMKNEA